jgi:hypothetical protein
MSVRFSVQVKTRNPLNGQAGNSRLASILRAKERSRQRTLCNMMTRAHVKRPEFPCVVKLTRVAPSNGLDPHDGLGAALKGVIDGVADGLGLTNDRDGRVTWELGQRRGKGYAVEVEITERP